MPCTLLITPETERAFATLPPQRAHAARELVLRKLKEVAELAVLRRYGGGAEAESVRVRVGSFKVHYAVDGQARTLTLLGVVRLPSLRLPSVG